MPNDAECAAARHLTPEQSATIVGDLKGSATGQVSITTDSADTEAVSYGVEIADALATAGNEVEMIHASVVPDEEAPGSLEVSIKEGVVRPGRVRAVMAAFLRAGLAFRTKIRARQRADDTVHINVGANQDPARVPPPGSAALIKKWRLKFLHGKF